MIWTETNSQIEQANLELESITNEINDYNSQIATLSAERDAAPEEAKFDYTTQIQSVQNDLKQSEYNRKSKQLEIDKMKTISWRCRGNEQNGRCRKDGQQQ